jgi:hypothetical protein
MIKTDDDLNYLAKFVEHLSSTFINFYQLLLTFINFYQLLSIFINSMHQTMQKYFFCDVTKFENFDKKCLTLTKKNQKSPFKNFRFGGSKSPVKGIKTCLGKLWCWCQ